MDRRIEMGGLIERRVDPSSVQYVHCQLPLHLHTARAVDFRFNRGREEILVQKVYVCYEWEPGDEWQAAKQ